MGVFNVYKNNGPSKTLYPYLLDVQSQLLKQLKTRLTIPLIAMSHCSEPIKHLNPEVMINRQRYFVLTQQMSALPIELLGEHVLSSEVDRSFIIAAVDFLITGF